MGTYDITSTGSSKRYTTLESKCCSQVFINGCHSQNRAQQNINAFKVTIAYITTMFRRLFTSNSRNISLLSRVWSGASGMLAGKQAEEKMISILRNTLPKAELIEVTDVSGGCGAMFEITVVAAEFKGLSTVKQHRIISDALKEEIKGMHGIRIHTSLPRP